MKKRKYLALLLSTVTALSLLSGCGSSSSSSSSYAGSTATGSANSSYSSSDYSSSDSARAITDGMSLAAYTGKGSPSKSTSSSGIAEESYSSSTSTTSSESKSTSTNESTSSSQSNTDTLTLLDEKLVYYCDLEIETTEYETTMGQIKETISKYGGLIQSEEETDSSYHWYYSDYTKTSGTMSDYIEIRVPSDSYYDFIAELDGVGKITSKRTSIENISQEYYDTTTQIEALEIQEQSLLDMLAACETIEDMLTVQERLTDVQYQLNSLNTSKRTMDTDVAYSYVNIEISEVMEYSKTTEPTKQNTFIDRLKNNIVSTGEGFLAFLEWLLFLVIRLLPYIVVIAILYRIFRKPIQARRAKRQEKKAKQQELQAYRAANQVYQNNMAMNMNVPPVNNPVIRNTPNINENKEKSDEPILVSLESVLEADKKASENTESNSESNSDKKESGETKTDETK
jgi:hypothetical protein